MVVCSVQLLTSMCEIIEVYQNVSIIIIKPCLRQDLQTEAISSVNEGLQGLTVKRIGKRLTGSVSSRTLAL